jgi:hypothetical protein
MYSMLIIEKLKNLLNMLSLIKLKFFYEREVDRCLISAYEVE